MPAISERQWGMGRLGRVCRGLPHAASPDGELLPLENICTPLRGCRTDEASLTQPSESSSPTLLAPSPQSRRRGAPQSTASGCLHRRDWVGELRCPTIGMLEQGYVARVAGASEEVSGVAPCGPHRLSPSLSAPGPAGAWQPSLSMRARSSQAECRAHRGGSRSRKVHTL